jgi:protein TonB
MSRLSIYANNWIDLVFEGKNQAYGAFQLRQKSDETTLLAFCLGISFVSMIATIPMLIASFSPNHQAEIANPVFDAPILHITNFKPNKPQTPVKLALPVTKKTPGKINKKEALINPVIVKPIDANTDIANTNEPATRNNSETSQQSNTGNNSNSVSTTTIGTTSTASNASEETLNTTVTVDKLPEFPGGISAFYAFIGDNFEKLEIEETVSVIVSFVIEKNGSMTDITVLRNASPSVDREAIRVLKSLKTKWKPGLKHGKPVRTEYKLPIKVKK